MDGHFICLCIITMAVHVSSIDAESGSFIRSWRSMTRCRVALAGVGHETSLMDEVVEITSMNQTKSRPSSVGYNAYY